MNELKRFEPIKLDKSEILKTEKKVKIIKKIAVALAMIAFFVILFNIPVYRDMKYSEPELWAIEYLGEKPDPKYLTSTPTTVGGFAIQQAKNWLDKTLYNYGFKEEQK